MRPYLRASGLIAVIAIAGGTLRCTDQILVGSFTRSGVVGQGGNAGSSNDAGGKCQPRPCKIRATGESRIYACGDCLDNDGDGLIDAEDPDCFSPCQNSEDSYAISIPGGSSDKCTQDCYFDQDTGAGNDHCLWSRSCDPLEVAPAYDPVGQDCAYDSTTTLQLLGRPKTCSDLMQTQDPLCKTACGPLTPNGCDCFGCCTVAGAPTPVWIGSTDAQGNATCDAAHVSDPTHCRPCTQVQSCLNPCDRCELCIGKTSLPADCVTDASNSSQCPGGLTPCGLASQPACPSGYYCVTGCCQPVIY